MIASGTRRRKYLFSMSFNPPLEANVPVEMFEQAITEAEARLGLTGQMRAIIFHEKTDIAMPIVCGRALIPRA